MTGPTPADVFGGTANPRPRRRPFFDTSPTSGTPSPSRWRARARDEASYAVDRLAAALGRLRAHDERDLDLAIEQYRRATARADAALDAFDDALADPAGPPVPSPTARDR